MSVWQQQRVSVSYISTVGVAQPTPRLDRHIISAVVVIAHAAHHSPARRSLFYRPIESLYCHIAYQDDADAAGAVLGHSTDACQASPAEN